MSRVLTAIGHVPDPAIAVLERSAERAGWTIRMVLPVIGEPVPEPAEIDALVVLGGPQSAYDTEQHPYLADEVELIRAAAARGVPVLGICLGSQLASVALGGSAQRGRDGLECGFIDVEARPGGTVFGGRYFSFHSDTFSPPPGAETLAASDRYPQAWRTESVTAVQFHPEIDRDGIVDLFAHEGPKLARYGVDVAAHVAAAEADPDPTVPGAALLDAWFAGLPTRTADPTPSPVGRSPRADTRT